MRLRASLCLAGLLAAAWIALLPPIAVGAAQHESTEGARAVGLGRGRTSVPGAGVRAAVGAATARMATEDERALIELTNTDRARHALAPLELDVELLELARARAGAQVTGIPLSHLDAAGEVALAKLLDEAGVPYALAAENLARVDATAGAPQSAQEALMGSRAHRENVLDPMFNRLAVGAAMDGAGRITFAEIFRAAP
jgi:uncharacterized protein YkwD